MPVNRNALVRYKTIDKCLQNHYRLWTLENLIDACSDALYEYEGISKGVSKRTIQGDLQMMRSDKLGYNAPIIVNEKKYYTYEDSNYSITNIPITNQDLGKLNETVDFLKQFKGFSHFKDLDGVIQKLEDHVYSQKMKQKPVIDFEKNEDLKGLHFLDTLYQSIINRKAIRLTYQSFKARDKSDFIFYPYLLKEYRNRWFIVGKRDKTPEILNLALDRIVSIKNLNNVFIIDSKFDSEAYFKHTIGVSVLPNNVPETVLLAIDKKHAPYILTKPFHHSQKVVEENYYEVIISLEVHHNFELEKEILGLGESIRVIKPKRLKRIINMRLINAAEKYSMEVSKSIVRNISAQLNHKGFGIYSNIFSKREIRKLNNLVEQEKEDGSSGVFNNIMSIKGLLINRNLGEMLEALSRDINLVEAKYYCHNKNIDITEWHQDMFESNKVMKVGTQEDALKKAFNVIIPLNISNRTSYNFRAYSGSHKQNLDKSSISTIVENSTHFEKEIPNSGVVILKPLLLQSMQVLNSKKQQRIIVLTFA